MIRLYNYQACPVLLFNYAANILLDMLKLKYRHMNQE